MTNLAIVTTHPFNYSTGTAVRVKEIAYELAKKGINVYILNPFEKNHTLKENVFVKNIPNLPFKLGFSDLFYNINRKIFVNKDISKLLLNTSYIEKSSKILAYNISPILEKYNIDVVQAEQEIAALSCIKLKKYKSISVFHNIWAEELVASKTINYDSNIYRIIKDFEKKIIDESDSVVVISDALKSFFIDNYNIDPNRLNVIYNGARKDVSKHHYSKKPRKIVYSGMLDYRQKVDIFVNSMTFIKNKYADAEFYLSRKGDEKDKIMKLVKQKNIPVNFTWFENDDDYYNFLKNSDIGILTSSNDIPRKLGIPSKLFNYMAAGIPVIANDIGGWTNIIKENKIGLLTKNDPNDFAEKINKLLSNPEKIEKMGKNAVDIIKNKYNWEMSAEDFIRIYDKN